MSLKSCGIDVNKPVALVRAYSTITFGVFQLTIMLFKGQTIIYRINEDIQV
jgi:hypothetical protein